MAIVYANSKNVEEGHVLLSLFSQPPNTTYTIEEIAVTNSVAVPYRIVFVETSATMDLKALDRDPLFIILSKLDEEEKFLYNIAGLDYILENTE